MIHHHRSPASTRGRRRHHHDDDGGALVAVDSTAIPHGKPRSLCPAHPAGAAVVAAGAPDRAAHEALPAHEPEAMGQRAETPAVPSGGGEDVDILRGLEEPAVAPRLPPLPRAGSARALRGPHRPEVRTRSRGDTHGAHRVLPRGASDGRPGGTYAARDTGGEGMGGQAEVRREGDRGHTVHEEAGEGCGGRAGPLGAQRSRVRREETDEAGRDAAGDDDDRGARGGHVAPAAALDADLPGQGRDVAEAAGRVPVAAEPGPEGQRPGRPRPPEPGRCAGAP
ncbi:hypothetical protein THAOC_00934, partial [Thalassiosira oceanica]